jgi:hypothetical protein
VIVYQMGVSRDPAACALAIFLGMSDSLAMRLPPDKIGDPLGLGVGHSRLARIVLEEFRARPGQRR